MALVPQYVARINTVNYGPIVDWYTPVTYTRPQPLTGGMPGHIAPNYSESKGMRPLMAPFTNPAISFYANDGQVNDRPYGYEEVYATPASAGLSGDWTLGRVIQFQMPLWSQHKTYADQLKTAVESRMIEDTWITQRPCLSVASYDSEIAILSYEQEANKLPAGYNIMDDFDVTTSGQPAPSLDATPCEMKITWKARRRYYETVQEVSNVLAFYDDAPELEPVTWEPMPGGTYVVIDHPTDVPFISGTSLLSINGAPPEWDIQPVRYESVPGAVFYPFKGSSINPSLTDNYTIPATPTGGQLEAFALAYFNLLNSAIEGERTIAWSGDFTNITYAIPYYVTAAWGSVGNISSGTIVLADVFPGGTETIFRKIQVFTGSEVEEVGSFGNMRPKKWKHDDPEFDGYVPYTEALWTGQLAYLEDYARNPDNRFDAFYFHYKIKVAFVTRAWQAVVMNRQTDLDPVTLPFKRAVLQQVAWYDTDTGQVIPSGNACSAMTPITSDDWLGPDVLGPVEIPGFNWEDYEWPATSVTIPAGTFLLEDGSSAPIYPTFYGAYVYDLHLKKWGKYDGEYKRLLDYAAINTYLPSQQSFSRFGIFGGILTADGKIRIFDESPAVSQVTYGKIGYYRQGMTSLEEVRVHHREFKTGVIKIESSIEGKLIDGSFTQEANFVDSPMWTKTGGYAAKWHNITIMGQFDLTYLEFRGIITGKR
jgi:hypothetical protein